MMLQLSTLIDAASSSSPVVFAMAVLVPALWWQSSHRLEFVKVVRPERLVWKLLPPANAPPGDTGGRS